jgi:hypothetical protein
MDYGDQTEKPKKLPKIGNIILVAFNLFFIFGIISINFSRDEYIEKSNQVFPPNSPLMNSSILDILVQKGFSIVFVILLAWIVIKEIVIRPLSRRIRLNFIILACLCVYSIFLLYMLYSPVVHS